MKVHLTCNNYVLNAYSLLTSTTINLLKIGQVRVTCQQINLSSCKQPNPRRQERKVEKNHMEKKQYPKVATFLWFVVPSTPLDIAQFLLGFERDKIRKQKTKSYYSTQVSKKFRHRVDYLISIGQPHKLSIQRNMKQTCKE